MAIALILAAAFLIKIPFLTAPLIGYFGSYQCTNAMMARNLMERGWSDLFIPRVQILLNGEPALHLLYFPFGSFAAFLGSGAGFGTIDFWGRFQAAAFMLLSAYLLYRIALHFYSRREALTAAFLFSFFPMNLIMGINFQNEAAAVFFMLAAVLLVLRRNIFAGSLLFSLAMIARIHFLPAGLVFLTLLILNKNRLRDYFLFAFGSLSLLCAWYAFQYHLFQTESAHVMTSLFSQAGDGRILKHPLLLDAAFYLRVLDYIFLRSMTPLAVPLALAALAGGGRKSWIWTTWIAGALACVFLLPQKVNDHPFYLLPALAPFAVLASLGLTRFRDRPRITAVFFSMFILLALRYYIPPAWSSWSPEALRIREIGAAVRQQAEADALIIASSGTSPELLYYTGHKGWPFDLRMDERTFDNRLYLNSVLEKGYGDLQSWTEYLRTQNARYLIITDTALLARKEAFAGYLNENFNRVQNPELGFVIYDLKETKH